MENTLQIILLGLLIILTAWNIFLYYRQRKQNENKDIQYHELNAKLNFIIAVGSLLILLISYLGFDVKDDILKKSEKPINDLVQAKSKEIDSLLASKNILKAGIYIVNDLDYKDNKVYRFKDLQTIDNKHLPDFAYEPKLIINTSTGENLRIEKVTTEYFILGKPISRSGYLQLEGENPKYPEIVKFDIWIADYKTK